MITRGQIILTRGRSHQGFRGNWDHRWAEANLWNLAALTEVIPTRAEDVLPNTNAPHAGRHVDHTSPALSVCALPSPPAATEWSCLLLHDVVYLQRGHYNAFSMGRKFVPGDLSLWPWHSNSCEWRTNHILHVNLVQILSAVPKTFHAQKSHRQRQKQNLTQFTVRV